MPSYLCGRNTAVRLTSNIYIIFLIYICSSTCPPNPSLFHYYLSIANVAFPCIFYVPNTLLQLMTKLNISCRNFLSWLQSSGVCNAWQLSCTDKAKLFFIILTIRSSSTCTSYTSGPHLWPRAQVHSLQSSEYHFCEVLVGWLSPLELCLAPQFHLSFVSTPYIFSFCLWSNRSFILAFIAKHIPVIPNLNTYCQVQVNSSTFLQLLKITFIKVFFSSCSLFCNLQKLRSLRVGQHSIFSSTYKFGKLFNQEV